MHDVVSSVHAVVDISYVARQLLPGKFEEGCDKKIVRHDRQLRDLYHLKYSQKGGLMTAPFFNS